MVVSRSKNKKPIATSGYVEVINKKPRKPVIINNGLTVLTIKYKDQFGRPCKFITSGHLIKGDEGQYHDYLVRRFLEERKLTHCRVQYDDFMYRSYEIYRYKGSQVERINPRKMDRTVKL